MRKVTMKWVNHASYTIKYQSIHLIVDPWLFGSSFNDGWDLLVESKFKIKDFRNITHIWFSHEHPDHFSPSVLSNIPEDIRNDITVLFQETGDKRVLNVCEQLSFKVKELTHLEKYFLQDDFTIICGNVGKIVGIDSWLLCEISRLKILNLNDCIIDKRKLCESIKNITGEVDILATQFSYANWIGNPEDSLLREKSAKEKLQRVKIQIESFKPRYTIPFASFIYFSHDENKYMNDRINTVGTATNFIYEQTDSHPVVLYPDDEWDCSSPHSNESALEKYKSAYDRLPSLPYRRPSQPIPEHDLLKASERYLKDLQKNNSIFAMKLLGLLPTWFGFRTLTIKLMDSDRYCSFNLTAGLRFIYSSPNSEDVTMSSQSLQKIFELQWGIGSLLVNGRYRASIEGRKKIGRIFMLGLMNSRNQFLSIGFLLNKVIEKVLRKIMGT
ncbi:MAG: MBL fold metallo-hydrolase [Candidatus Marinimicrobia bacterium]|nr:MBL fold metallo-hydrolase [Candidatus Neomarinimicrobiota bacterium]